MSQVWPSSPLPAPVCRWREVGAPALLTAMLVGCYAGWSAWDENRHRTVSMDLDGWGAIAQRLKPPDAGPGALFSDPPVWKGPVVPFVFGLCYYVAPVDESVLVFNVIAIALASGLFVVGFCSFGVDRLWAALAALLGACYWAHHYVFGYYYAEPILLLFLSLLLLLFRWAVSSKYNVAAFFTGGVAGLALLARPPFLLLVCAIPALLWWHSTELRQRWRRVACFVLGLGIVFAPWTLRNFLTFHEFIPFTTEGGKILFQGTYLPGDDLTINEIREMPEYAELEKQEGDDPIAQYRYWRTLAMKQVRQDPAGQLRLCVRKALRFWVYLPKHSWVPSWKTALVAALALPLAVVGVLQGRRQLIVQLSALWVGGLWGIHALVHTELRYNYPILPFVFLLAAMGGHHLLSRWFLRSPISPTTAALFGEGEPKNRD
jgi:hypothetical protein